MLDLPSDKSQWLEWAENDFAVSDYLPRGYLGPRNDLGQLKAYVIGWNLPAEQRWTDDRTGFRYIDYPEILAHFRVTNANAYGNFHPFDFFAAPVSPRHVKGPWIRKLQQIIWLKASQNRGEALILESKDGDIAYLPIQDLLWSQDDLKIEQNSDRDPLLYEDVVGPMEWLSPREWADRSGDLRYSLTPVILADLFRRNYKTVLNDPLFLEQIPPRDREMLVEALRFRFDQGVPDFRVWMHRGWNVNTKSHTPGGTHGGFNPLETRTAFLMWAGHDLHLKRGETVPGRFLTYDIVPTLLQAIGVDSEDFKCLPGIPIPFFQNSSVPETGN